MSSGESCSTIGIANPSVFPEPVWDFASVSRPEVASCDHHHLDREGLVIPRLARVWITSSDTPRSRNDVKGDAEDESMHDERTPRTAGATVPRLGGRLATSKKTSERSHRWTIEYSSGTSSRRSSPSTASDAPRRPHRDIRPHRCRRRTSLAVLYADHLRTHVSDPDDPANDRFVLSKGHAAPVLYSALKAIGAISDEELLTLRRFGSPIQGHPAPVPELPWVDVATGSLGQGLPIGVGMAFSMRLDGSPGRVWVMVGDSEMAEGSVWEAMETASFHQLGGLTAILDLNRLGQRGPTMHGWNADVFRDRALAFGWHAIEIDGHDVAEIDAAYMRGEEHRSADDDRRTHGEGPRSVPRGRTPRDGTARRSPRSRPSRRSRSWAASGT